MNKEKKTVAEAVADLKEIFDIIDGKNEHQSYEHDNVFMIATTQIEHLHVIEMLEDYQQYVNIVGGAIVFNGIVFIYTSFAVRSTKENTGDKENE